MSKKMRDVVPEPLKPQFSSETVKEGKVKVLVPKLDAFIKKPWEYAPSKAPVFYNPAMEMNRDLAVIAVQAYQKMVDRKISICEPLTGSGLRGIRVAVEVDRTRKVVLGDINERAFRLADCNVRFNCLANRIAVRKREATHLLSSFSAPRKRFDVIDIDPFGSPVPFMDSAVRALRNNGLLALTATDMASLCGVHPRACLRKYGGKSLRTEYCHELAVRLLIGCLAATAAKYDLGISPVFSHRGEHYVRAYAIFAYGAKRADESLKQMGLILHCFKCFHRETVRGLFQIGRSGTCPECGSTLSVSGPLWLSSISDPKFCRFMEQGLEKRDFRLKEKTRKMLALIAVESSAPVTYFVVDTICDALNIPVPSVRRVVQVLKEGGSQATLTHFNTRGMRSDLSAKRLTEIVRELALTR